MHLGKKNCGVLQSVVLSPFFFTLHTSDLFSESLASFLKYANEVNLDLKANINGNALPTTEPVTDLGVTFSDDTKWPTHVEEIFRMCVRLSFFVNKLRGSSPPAEFIPIFPEAYVLLLIFFCPQTIFPGLLK